MQSYGYDIIKALVTDIDPDEQVKHAMNRINAAEREKPPQNMNLKHRESEL
jgi:regulator of protease activity HflC (stomatin/prohibitin superfamily)